MKILDKIEQLSQLTVSWMVYAATIGVFLGALGYEYLGPWGVLLALVLAVLAARSMDRQQRKGSEHIDTK